MYSQFMMHGQKNIKLYISVAKTSHLTLYSGLMAVSSEIHTKYLNTLCGQNK